MGNAVPASSHEIELGPAIPHKKLREFSEYYNSARVHYSPAGQTPSEKSANFVTEAINLKTIRWKSFCSERFSIPCAA